MKIDQIRFTLKIKFCKKEAMSSESIIMLKMVLTTDGIYSEVIIFYFLIRVQ